MYYKASKVNWGNITFDSKLEFEVFRTLKRRFYLPNISVHQPIVIRPKTTWFKPQLWKVDFVIKTKELQGEKLYVEVKGIVQADFKERMKNLSYFFPQIFENLVVVCPVSQTIVRGFTAYGTKDFELALQGNLVQLVSQCKSVLED